jgi:two-component system, OmpR family, copper resistance phosphate regulon response regulator CusR
MRTLVIEDDAPLAEFLEKRLRDDHFAVDIAGDGAEGQRLVDNSAYDLVILDLNLPRVHGLEVLRHIRVKKPDLPVLLLTGANAVDERVKGLDAGADDYLAKPFSYAELAARMRAVIRRSGATLKAVLKVDDLELDRIARTVRRGSCGIELTPKEFSLLEFLMQRPRQPVTRLMISELAWKLEGDTLTNVVDVYINYLRRKIDSGHACRLIRTVRGVGYQIGGQ